MAEILSKIEIEDLRRGINELMIVLEKNRKELYDFFEKPIQYLNRFRIKILDYIRLSQGLRTRFVAAIRELIGSFQNVVNRCLRCKLAVIFIMMATLGKSAQNWGAIMEVIEKVKNGIKEYLEDTSDQLDNILRTIDDFVNRGSPSRLALRICESLGYCSA